MKADKFSKLYIPIGFKGSAADLAGGCGSGWNDKVVPDSLIGVSIKKTCKIHDYMYTIGQTREQKLDADRMFLYNMRVLIYHDSSLALRTTRLHMAYTYYLFVRDMGNDPYWEGKERPKRYGATWWDKTVDWLTFWD